MKFDELKKKLDKARQEWQALERNNPEEYERQIAAMQPVIDRYNSEFAIFDEEEEPTQDKYDEDDEEGKE